MTSILLALYICFLQIMYLKVFSVLLVSNYGPRGTLTLLIAVIGGLQAEVRLRTISMMNRDVGAAFMMEDSRMCQVCMCVNQPGLVNLRVQSL